MLKQLLFLINPVIPDSIDWHSPVNLIKLSSYMKIKYWVLDIELALKLEVEDTSPMPLGSCWFSISPVFVHLDLFLLLLLLFNEVVAVDCLEDKVEY